MLARVLPSYGLCTNSVLLQGYNNYNYVVGLLIVVYCKAYNAEMTFTGL